MNTYMTGTSKTDWIEDSVSIFPRDFGTDDPVVGLFAELVPVERSRTMSIAVEVSALGAHTAPWGKLSAAAGGFCPSPKWLRIGESHMNNGSSVSRVLCCQAPWIFGGMLVLGAMLPSSVSSRSFRDKLSFNRQQ